MDEDGGMSDTTGCNEGSGNAGVEVHDCTRGDWKTGVNVMSVVVENDVTD